MSGGSYGDEGEGIGSRLLLDALGAADFDRVASMSSVWVDDPYEVAGINLAAHDEAMTAFVARTMGRAAASTVPPQGLVLVGGAGSGKTHMAGRFRRHAWERGGTYVHLHIQSLGDFWRSVALSVSMAMRQGPAGGPTQGETILHAIAAAGGKEDRLDVLADDPSKGRPIVDELSFALRRLDPVEAPSHREAYKALLFATHGTDEQREVADAWLQGLPLEHPDMNLLGMRDPGGNPAAVTASMMWLASRSGPTLVVMDHVDPLVNQAEDAGEYQATRPITPAARFASHVLGLQPVCRRAMLVVTCTDETWISVKDAMDAAAARFHPKVMLRKGIAADGVEALLATRLRPAYDAAGVSPPSPSWPFTEAAQEAFSGGNPRTILVRADEHRARCLAAGRVTAWAEDGGEEETPRTPTRPPGGAGPDRLGRDFEEERGRAVLTGLFGQGKDCEKAFGELLNAACSEYAAQGTGDAGVDVENRADPGEASPALNGRVTFAHVGEGHREVHHSFRAFEYGSRTWHAFRARINAAMTASGIGQGVADRHLVIVRRSPLPATGEMGRLSEEFTARGGRVMDWVEDDVRTFAALRALRARANVDPVYAGAYGTWLRSARPLDATTFFRDGIGGTRPAVASVATARDAPATPAGRGAPADREDPSVAPRTGTPRMPPPVPGGARDEPMGRPGIPAERGASPVAGEGPDVGRATDGIPVGLRFDGGTAVLPVRELRRHVAVMAGSGSGKSVLLRRLVEEAALAGVASIVVDTGGDLARLGEPWPSRPPGFGDDDVAKAARLAREVEFVTWTPGVARGRPLDLPVFPDPEPLLAGGAEADACIDAVREALATVFRGERLADGVLPGALRHMARRGGRTPADLADALADLPEGTSRVASAERVAARMADRLNAAIEADPALRRAGPATGVGELFGNGGGRTRVSVVYLPGLGLGPARETFVARLAAAAFAHAIARPSAIGRLFVLDEAQNYVPAGRDAIAKAPVSRIASEGRKYGLGLVVATQQPRGIENAVVSNAATRVIGRQGSPAAVEAAQSMIAGGGGAASAAVGRLGAGQFHASLAGGRFERIDAPLCLTRHEGEPPGLDEVAARAAAGMDEGR